MNNNQEPLTPDSSRKHKGGRPHIPEEQKRTVCKKAYFTTEEAKCVELAADENRMSDSEYMNIISSDFNLYREQKNAVAKEQEQTLKIVAQQAETAKRLETVIGRIEDVQGVKAPKRPPFPSWAYLVYLFTCSGTGLCMVLLFSGSRSTSADSASSSHSL